MTHPFRAPVLAVTPTALAALGALSTLEEWRSTIQRNFTRLRGGVQGQPHERNLERWEMLIDSGDVRGLHRVLTGLDRDLIERREVSPLGGLLITALTTA